VKKIIPNTGLIILAIALVTGVIGISGCRTDQAAQEPVSPPPAPPPPVEEPLPTPPAEEPVPLEPVEIREYEGEQLSSINDFRENSILGPQQVDIEGYTLEITGLVNEPQAFTYDEVISDHQQYKKVVTIDCVEGWSVKLLWEGVLVRDLIVKADPQPETEVVIFHAYDGYTTSLPIDYIMDNDILIAYKMNDVTLPPERGFPFELVAESKWGYKWIKWITKIELSSDTDYRGFWESRGYSNTADLDKGFFGD
jgi:DMSO/TMAO reductase YedYZ molybdopterin-dependent catalytic subunit